MNGNTIASLAAAALLAVLGGTLVWLCWEPKPTEAERAEAARARVGLPLTGPGLTGEDEHDVGPDALRLLADLDAHLDQQFAQLANLYQRLGPADLDAGCDEPQEGESA
ncbi:hypothetical protein [Streptomyces cellulosae]|uniref:hypothetical protein n=1 Tax=Streptomyces cellulosae TaxID=1968 RepID=UPI0004C5586C|nr:hypothetical protein [Streptomyces cellulosae]